MAVVGEDRPSGMRVGEPTRGGTVSELLDDDVERDALVAAAVIVSE